ncbi:unnamed protein product [Phaeothamnion confervicola]
MMPPNLEDSLRILLRCCVRERVGYKPLAFRALLRARWPNLRSCFGTMQEAFRAYHFLAEDSVLRHLDPGATARAPPPAVSEWASLGPLPRCSVCTLPPPCRHVSEEQLAAAGRRRRADLPRQPPGSLPCPGFLRTGACDLFNRCGRCSLDHPPRKHGVVTLAPRCPICTIRRPCGRCPYDAARAAFLAACDGVEAELRALGVVVVSGGGGGGGTSGNGGGNGSGDGVDGGYGKTGADGGGSSGVATRGSMSSHDAARGTGEVTSGSGGGAAALRQQQQQQQQPQQQRFPRGSHHQHQQQQEQQQPMLPPEMVASLLQRLADARQWEKTTDSLDRDTYDAMAEEIRRTAAAVLQHAPRRVQRRSSTASPRSRRSVITAGTGAPRQRRRRQLDSSGSVANAMHPAKRAGDADSDGGGSAGGGGDGGRSRGTKDIGGRSPAPSDDSSGGSAASRRRR